MHYYMSCMKAPLGFFLSIAVFFIFFDSFGADMEPFQRGLRHYADGDFEVAASYLEEAKHRQSRNDRVYFYLGNVYFQLDRLDDAIINYTTGLNFAERKGRFFYNLGNCYYLKKNYSFAADMYSKALEHDPGLVQSHLNAGNAFYRMGEYEDTVSQWETYLAKDPQTPQYAEIKKAIAYLKDRLASGPGTEVDAAAADQELMNEVMRDLDQLVESTRSIMETSEKPVDDLTVEGIER